MKHKLKWYALDTSAKIYPAIESDRTTTVFRVSMKLKESVKEEILLEAMHNIKNRFPYYNVHMKNGLFWHYLEQNNKELLVWNDTPSPCERVHPYFNHGNLYKIKFYGKNIALEVSHVLTDGYGAMEFLKCLVHQYLLIQGKVSENYDNLMDYLAIPLKEEYEDAFLKVIEKEPNKPKIEKNRSLFNAHKSYQIRSRLMSAGLFRVVTGVVPTEDLKKISKQYGVTITQLVASLYLEALIHLQSEQIKNKKDHRPVSVQIPVNMRNIYPSKCMRNFSLFVIPVIDPRKVSNLEDIMAEVVQFMEKYLSHDYLLTMVHENCSLAKNQFIMNVPSAIKNLIIGYVTNTQGATQFSGTLSNLGIVKLSDEMKEHVENSLFQLGPSKHEKCSCSMLGYNGNVYISFGKSMKETYIEKHIFRRLVKMGVKIKVMSNY